MNNTQYLTLIFLSLLLTTSCSLSKQNKSSLDNDKKEPNLITFLVLNIHMDTIKSQNIVEFVSKKESTGVIKKQHSFPTKYYLTIYAYSGKHIIDSLILEHPLYKHIEYVDENKNFAVMDTIIKSAEFFVRLQGHFNEIKIFETLKNKSTQKLNTIKF
jgi:hypothetical protein